VKDFSDVDLKFALNVGVEFRIPESIFDSEGKSKVKQKDIEKTLIVDLSEE
jgi:hypothetical protein